MSHNSKIRFICRNAKSKRTHQSLKTLLRYAHKNLKNWTYEEKLMNGWLSNLRLKHSNQAVFPPYIADIVLTDYPVIIELDGSQHQYNKLYDERRDQHFKDLGYTVLRIQNHEMQNKSEVIKTIQNTISFFISPIQ